MSRPRERWTAPAAILFAALAFSVAGLCGEAAAPKQAKPTAGMVEETKKELGEGFIVTVEGPFIIASDLTLTQHNRFAKGTVKACYEAYNKQYFRKRPTNVITVYLLNGPQSYAKYVRKTFGRDPTTPYGFYSPVGEQLVMNIRTGGGTLVHEMFHSLVKYDFPAIPSWLNEGIASLYEQCRITPKGLVGLKNWRYPGLMRGIAEGRAKPLKELMALSTDGFYGTGSGLHYAQARYFCMYLQERGLLVKFYEKFRKGVRDDPTGFASFKAVIAPQSVEEFEKALLEWEKKLGEP